MPRIVVMLLLKFFTAMSYLLLTINAELSVETTHNCQQNDKLAFEENVCESSVTGLILARGGSKGIPLKNIVLLQGEPLLARTLRTMQRVGKFHEIWVSTDHELIADVGKKYAANIFKRAPDYAKDDTPSIVSVQEFLNKTITRQYIALVQVTSPFLKVKYLNEAFAILQTGKECVFSVTRTFKLRWTFKNDQLEPLNFNPERRPRRQDWEGELVENGMFYFASRRLLESGKFQSKNCGVVEVDKIDALEIDSPLDLKLAELISKSRNN